MSVVKINALEIPPQAGDEIVKRFTARMSSLADVVGFEGFELLRPTGDSETRWFVYTRWTDQAAYEGWRDGDGARNAHAGPTASTPESSTPESSTPESSSTEDGRAQGKPPVSMGATLLEFEVEVSAGPSDV